MTTNKPICIGIGLIALDVILNGSPKTVPKISTGGSCGNVLSILAFLNWESMPVARLADNSATKELLLDFNRWNVNNKFLKINENGSTPIIIHRILKNKNGDPIHRFEFRDPESKDWLPNFKPITRDIAKEIINIDISPSVFYFDRMNPGTIELATYFRSKGALIFFEPSSMKDEKVFRKCLSISHIVKYSNDRLKEYKTKFTVPQAELEIETRGKEGIAFRTARSNSAEWKTIRPYHIENVVDSAGAGDWCSAGIISKLGNGGYTSFKEAQITAIEEALDFGQLLGAMNCLLDGARGLMYHFTRKQISNIVSETLIAKSSSLGKLKLTSQSKIDISKQIQVSDLY